MDIYRITIVIMLRYFYITEVESIRLRPKPSYLLAVPRIVRPDDVLKVYVSVFDVKSNLLTVTASIAREGSEYATARHHFTTPSQTLLLLQVPEYATEGNYTLTVFGQTDNSGGYLFYNETQLTFHSKRVSVFIQTDRKLFKRSDSMKFRVIALTKELMPVKTGTITVYVKDPHGKVLYRFLSQVVNNGYYENSIKLPHAKVYGWWSVEVHGWGHVYTEPFNIYGFFACKIWVNASMPSYFFENEYGLEGSIISNFTKGFPLKGNATISMEMTSAHFNGTRLLEHKIPAMEGRTSFLIPMSDIKKAIGGNHHLPGTKIKTTIDVFDWYTKDVRFKPAVVKSEIYSSVIQITILGGSVRTFKPFQPFPIVAAFHLEDGSPYKSDQYRLAKVEVTVERSSGPGKTFYLDQVIPPNGVIQTYFTPEKDHTFITVRIWLSGVPRHAEMTASRHQTRSNHFLSVVTSTVNPRVNTYMIFTVRVSTYIPRLYYMVMSKANILIASSISMKSVQHTFSLAVSKDMVPEAKIIVYGLLNGEEVLVDSLQFHAKGIRTDLNVQVNKGKDFSRDTMEINGVGDKSSFIVLAATQYELYRRDIHSLFTEYKVEQDLLSYEADFNTSYSHLFYDEEKRPYNLHYHAPSYGIDPNSTFQFAGLAVYTDADLYERPGHEICNITLGYLSCFDSSCYEISRHCNGERDCKDGADELGCEKPPVIKRPDEVDSIFFDTPVYDSALWAWKTSYTKPYGRADLKLNVPLRPRTWLLSGFTLSHTEGLSFNEHPARLDATRLFYIVLEYDTISYWGEQLGMQVTLFNYWDQSLEAIVTLHGSSDYRFVNVGEFGIVRSYDPRTTAGDIQTMVYLEAGEVKYIHMPILPTRTGKIKVTVSGESMLGRYTASHSITVKMDGVTNTYHTPYLVDLRNQGSVLIPDFWIPVPERFALPEQREHLYVPGSQKATVSIVGDVYGPGLFTSYPDLYKLFNIVEGNAVQTSFGFGYNALLLKYLKVINQLNPSRLNSVLKSMSANLVKMSAFVHKDGGAAIDGNGAPNVETSALFLLILGDGFETEWEHILYIDPNMVNRMVEFVLTQQNPDTGAFHTHRLYDIRLRSNLTDENGNPLDLPLTASVIIGLNNAKVIAKGAALSGADGAIARAAGHLGKYLQLIRDPYVMCLVTYALHLANHNSKTDAYTLMERMVYKGEYYYWSPEEIPRNPTKIINGRHYLYPREMPSAASSRAVQATAYALIVYLRYNRLADAEPIMMWLQTQRDFDAGFIGVIDTLAASRALLEYARRDISRDLMHMQIQLDASATPNWVQTHSISRESLTDYATFNIPNVYGGVQASAIGSGLALLQMTTKVNVEYPWQLRQYERPSFDVFVNKLEFTGRNMSHFKMEVCARWLRTDISPNAGPCIIEIDPPTGYEVKKDILRANQRKSRIHQPRARFAMHRVILFLDDLDAEGDCWSFTSERTYPVANTTIQHMVRITHGTDRAFQNTSLYRTDGLFHQHICQTCGSFQCPYCPFYNSANPSFNIDCKFIFMLIFNILYLFRYT